MKPLSQRDPFRIGLVALALAVVVGVLVVMLSVVKFGSESYTAVLAQTAGLRTGEDVQVHGVPSGEVTDIALVGETVQVTFVLEKDIALGDQSTAAVKVATLLGTHYLEVTPAGEGELSDDEIPLARTSVPYNLQDVIEKGTTKLDELDPDLLAQALTEASKTLGASQQEITPALAGVARLSDLVVRRSGQTGELLRAARTVTSQLSDSSEDIFELMRQSNLVIGEITSRRRAIHRLLVETTTLSKALQSIVDRTKNDIRPTLRNLNLALTSLNREDDALKRVLTVLAPATRYVANATGSGPWLDLYTDPPVIPTDQQLCALGNCP